MTTKLFVELWSSNSFIMAFVVVGILSYLAQVISNKVTRGRVHASAIAILFGLVLAYIGAAGEGSPKRPPTGDPSLRSG